MQYIHCIYGAHPTKMAHKNFDCAPSAHNPKILELSLQFIMSKIKQIDDFAYVFLDFMTAFGSVRFVDSSSFSVGIGLVCFDEQDSMHVKMLVKNKMLPKMGMTIEF